MTAGHLKIGGLVLAGGRSRRFGSEKAMAALEGRPLIAHVAAALDLGCAEVAVNAPPGSAAGAWARDMELPLLPDPSGAPDGPLTGVLEGLRWAAASGFDALVTAPCDTPWLPGDVVFRLAEGAEDAPAACAVTAAGSHPLCALWRPALAEPLAATLHKGHPSVRAWLAQVGAEEVMFEDARAFANLNTPHDLAGYG